MYVGYLMLRLEQLDPVKLKRKHVPVLVPLIELLAVKSLVQLVVLVLVTVDAIEDAMLHICFLLLHFSIKLGPTLFEVVLVLVSLIQ